jgi:hypothetical protein
MRNILSAVLLVAAATMGSTANAASLSLLNYVGPDPSADAYTTKQLPNTFDLFAQTLPYADLDGPTAVAGDNRTPRTTGVFRTLMRDGTGWRQDPGSAVADFDLPGARSGELCGAREGVGPQAGAVRPSCQT